MKQFYAKLPEESQARNMHTFILPFMETKFCKRTKTTFEDFWVDFWSLIKRRRKCEPKTRFICLHRKSYGDHEKQDFILGSHLRHGQLGDS